MPDRLISPPTWVAVKRPERTTSHYSSAFLQRRFILKVWMTTLPIVFSPRFNALLAAEAYHRKCIAIMVLISGVLIVSFNEASSPYARIHLYMRSSRTTAFNGSLYRPLLLTLADSGKRA